MNGPKVELSLAGIRVVAVGGPRNIRVMTVNAVRRAGAILMTPVHMLFPPEEQAGPVRVPPGNVAEIDVAVRAAGCDHIHLYPEAASVTGAADVDLSPAQAVELDERGVGSATIRAAPKDDRNTGIASVRIAAVHPDEPDTVAAELRGTHLAIAGTGRLVNMVLVAAILAGIGLELVQTTFPIIGTFILAALIFAWINAPKSKKARFRPLALLPYRRRLVAALGIVGGFACWYILMAIGLDDDVAISPYCGEPAQPACTFADTLTDNITSGGAAILLFACIFVVLSPAFRPRRLAGYAFALCALVPLMFYDFSLIGSGMLVKLENFKPIEGDWTVKCDETEASKALKFTVSFDKGPRAWVTSDCAGVASAERPSIFVLHGRSKKAPGSKVNWVFVTPGKPNYVRGKDFNPRLWIENDQDGIVTVAYKVEEHRFAMRPGPSARKDRDAESDQAVWEAMRQSPTLYAPNKAFVYGYSVFGWGLAAFALFGLFVHQGTKITLLSGLAFVSGILSIGAAITVSRLSMQGFIFPDRLHFHLLPAHLDWLAILFPVVAASTARLALFPSVHRGWLRTALFGIVMAILALVLYGVAAQRPMLVGTLLVIFAVGWTFAEIGIWQRRRDDARKKRLAPDETSDEAPKENETALA